ncbi:TrgA family protein [Roseinatronobacter monicus]|uniref:Uncharacterized protein n=1 Tax=Roseinatronobacter monicus TaxID=393481 RepID=A0A543KCU2_9RHOB|nr:TrgA family protein [Roseinatronobacter monicus]TQM92908.1 hypothetical protein BD293_1530 [Roseinatronobacter monicus]
MPTITRLVAMVLFGIVAFSLVTQFHLLDEDPPRSQASNFLFAVVAGLVGWRFVGLRITRDFAAGFTIVVQGYVATLLISLTVAGMYDIFANGYRLRYRSFAEAFTGSMSNAYEVLLQMKDVPFLSWVLGSALLCSFLLVLIYRTAETRRISG